MDYTDIQFGNFEPEFDLSADITGSAFHTTSNNEDLDTQLPNNFWLQNESGTTTVFFNNDQPGKADDKFGDTVKINDQYHVINKVYLMAMRGINVFELERTLKLAVSNDDFQTNSFLQNSLFLLPMVGSVIW